MSLGQLRQKIVIAAVGLLLALPLHAGEPASPVVPKAKAKATEKYGCVEPVSKMRKNHMEFLLHQRDDTMRRGIRTKKFSLVECVNCHVTPKKDGSYARFGESEHFCSSCHNYAAVKIDCFDCHRDTPENSNARHTLNDETSPHHTIAFKENDPLTTKKLDNVTSGGTE